MTDNKAMNMKRPPSSALYKGWRCDVSLTKSTATSNTVSSLSKSCMCKINGFAFVLSLAKWLLTHSPWWTMCVVRPSRLDDEWAPWISVCCSLHHIKRWAWIVCICSVSCELGMWNYSKPLYVALVLTGGSVREKKNINLL